MLLEESVDGTGMHDRAVPKKQEIAMSVSLLRRIEIISQRADTLFYRRPQTFFSVRRSGANLFRHRSAVKI